MPLSFLSSFRKRPCPRLSPQCHPRTRRPRSRALPPHHCPRLFPRISPTPTPTLGPTPLLPVTNSDCFRAASLHSAFYFRNTRRSHEPKPNPCYRLSTFPASTFPSRLFPCPCRRSRGHATILPSGSWSSRTSTDLTQRADNSLAKQCGLCVRWDPPPVGLLLLLGRKPPRHFFV